MSENYVSVPRELLEAVTEYSGSFHPMEPARAKLRALLSAPAEDVRAVVEEPVGYASETQLKRMAKGYTETLSLCAKRSDLIGGVALYRHPQRPIVLPERKILGHYAPSARKSVAAYNQAIDDCEELNK